MAATMKSIKLMKISSQPLSVEESRITELTLVKPIIGAALSARDYFDLSAPYLSKNGRLLTPGEVGCALSHIEVYNSILRDTQCEGALIFEQDISLNQKLISDAFRVIKALNPDFLHIGWHPNIEKKEFFRGYRVCEVEGRQIWRIDSAQNFYGTFAYFVSRAACEQLVAFHSSYIRKADDWATFFGGSNIPALFCGIVYHPFERGELEQERRTLRICFRSLWLAEICHRLKQGIRRRILNLIYFRRVEPEAPTQQNVHFT